MFDMDRLNLVKRYHMLHINKLSDYTVVDYWQTLLEKGLLAQRLYDTVDPKLSDVEEMLASPDNLCYIMWDAKERKVCADTMINNIRGLVAQVHFSMHPDYFGKETVRIAKEGVEQHFLTKIRPTGEYIQTLFGITPVRNRMAVRFIQKVGFKPICQFEKVCYMADLNQHEDGLLTQLNVKDLYNGR